MRKHLAIFLLIGLLLTEYACRKRTTAKTLLINGISEIEIRNQNTTDLLLADTIRFDSFYMRTRIEYDYVSSYTPSFSAFADLVMPSPTISYDSIKIFNKIGNHLEDVTSSFALGNIASGRITNLGNTAANVRLLNDELGYTFPFLTFSMKEPPKQKTGYTLVLHLYSTNGVLFAGISQDFIISP